MKFSIYCNPPIWICLLAFASINLYVPIVYIYIYCHLQAVSLYNDSPVWLDTQNATSWDRNAPNFTLDLVSYRSAISATYDNSGIIKHFTLAFVCLHFAPSDTRVLNSLEDLSITRVAAVNSFVRVFNLREVGVYIVIH